MKKYILVVLLSLTSAAFAADPAPVAPIKSEKDQIAELTARNTELAIRNAALEAVIKDLRAQRDTVTQQMLDAQLQMSEMVRAVQKSQKKE